MFNFRFLKKLWIVPILAGIAVYAFYQKEQSVGTEIVLNINFQEGDFPSLHPHDLMPITRGLALSKVLYEGLTRENEEGIPELAGAESIDISEDRLRYIFKLRKNFWSDGTPVTAFEYERGWKEVLDPNSLSIMPELLWMLKNGEKAKRGEVSLDEIGVKALDAETLVVDLEYPVPHFLGRTAQPICAPLKEPKNRGVLLFNGPFIIDVWEKGVALNLKKNPHFWNRDQIKLDKIKGTFVEDQNAVFACYKSGAFDWLGIPFCPISKNQIKELNERMELRAHPIDRIFWVCLNTKQNHLSSPKIRKALGMAIDRKAVTEHISIGSEILRKPFPEREISNPSVRIHENKQAAKQLFEAGMEELGYTRETFPEIEILSINQGNRLEFFQFLQDTWIKTFGIKVRLTEQTAAVIRSAIYAETFQVTSLFMMPYCSNYMEIFERLGISVSTNWSRWMNAEYREFLDLAKRNPNPDARKELLASAERILAEESPVLPVFVERLFYSHNPKFKGFRIDSTGAVDVSYVSPVETQEKQRKLVF